MQILPIRRKSLVSKIAIAPALAANILRTQRVGLAMLCLLMSAAGFGQVTTQPGEWTWAGGNTHGSGAVWGTLGTPAAANIPGDRQNAAAWTDPSGNFWLFGGNGSDSLNNWGYLNDLWEYNLATNEWEWVSGSSTINCVAAGCFNPGVYGTLGTPSAGNIPGSREYGLSWIDSSGDLWLFGGLGYDAGGTFGILNDLWEFNPSTKLWTWVGGSTLESGAQIGVYGTVGTAASENIPGARSNAVSWTDTKGNFWLFGGGGYDSRGTNGTLNDVWEFNPSTSLWTWMGGSSTTWMSGVYGSLGTPAAGNIPGARAYAKSWTDGAGNFWLFGGMGFDGNYSFGYLDDLWQFNPSTNEWTWMGGNTKLGSTCQNTSGTTCGQIGMYGTLGTPSAGNMPGSRFDSAGWTDSAGNLWLFGGNGFDSTGAYGDLNELWEFNPFTGQWAWMGGSNTVGVNGGQPGIYGTLGTPAPGNIPGGRSSVETWTAMSGNLWLMGGCGFNASDGPDCLNDLWEYQPADTVASPAAATPTFNLTPGNYDTVQTLTISDTTSGATIYYSVNGTAPTINSPVYNGEITVSSPTTIEAIAVAGSHSNSAVATATYDVVAPTTATPSFSLSSGIYGAAQTVTLSDGTPEATIYYTTDGSTPTSSSNVYGGGILISSSATLKAMAAFAGYVNSPVATVTYDITPLAANGTLQWTWMGGSGITGSYCFTTSPGEPWQETTCGRAGVYGTLGTPAAGNLPGSRVSPATWTDSSGSLWLFGGAGYDVDGNEGILSDLWTFNPTTSLWTWMGGGSTGGQAGVYGTMGTPSAGNIPGGRYSPAVWTDRSGNVWLFGGGGAVDANGNSGYINDLWEYNPSTNLWAWMGGNSTVDSTGGDVGVYGTLGTAAAGNIPGGRSSTATWTDANGNFWLFGGQGVDGNGNGTNYGDFWELNPSTLQWAWMGGSAGQSPSVYGSLGTPAAGNFPGSRTSPSSWTDNSGNFWMFGGDSGNDLWEFNPSTNLWAWMGGTSTYDCSPSGCADNGVYGTLGSPSSGNFPGAHDNASDWVDSSGNLWFFGGSGIDANGSNGEMNDLWEFNPSTHQWAWMGGNSTVGDDCFNNYGSTLCGQSGTYGTLGVTAGGNFPGSRDSSTGSAGSGAWTDKNGNFWLFGGNAVDLNGAHGDLNDMWKYQAPPPIGGTPVITSISPIASLKEQTITISGSGFGFKSSYTGDSNYIELADSTGNPWYAGHTGNGATLAVASWTDTQIVLAGLSGSYGPAHCIRPGDQLTVTVWNAQSGSGPAVYPIVASSGTDNCDLAITSVSAILPQQTQTITITGTGFGSQSAYTGDSNYITLSDSSGNPWFAGQTGNIVTLAVSSWTDSQIVLSGFSGAYGPGGNCILPGDQLSVSVWNAQTGAGPAVYPIAASSGINTCTPAITSVSAILAQQTQTITITGTGFGTQSAYTGDSNYITLADSSGNPWFAGQTGNTVTLAVSSWTNSQIVLSGLTGTYGIEHCIHPGDQLSVSVWNAQYGNGPAVYPIVASGGTDYCPAEITSVSPILPQQAQTITITGAGFGTQAAYTGDSNYIEVVDTTSNWFAGHTGNGVTLTVSSWTDAQIVITGFAGSYGANHCIRAGDQLSVSVWNVQTGAGGVVYPIVAGSGSNACP